MSEKPTDEEISAEFARQLSRGIPYNPELVGGELSPEDAELYDRERREPPPFAPDSKLWGAVDNEE